MKKKTYFFNVNTKKNKGKIMPTQKKVTSVQDLLRHLNSDIKKYSGAIWYRGHARYTWKLEPGYIRLSNPPSEHTLLKKFRQNASFLLSNKPENSFDWLFLMQHYGVPTRLLDWTESPLAALYFAVTEDKYKKDNAALWLLFPSELNRNANIEAEEKFYIPSFDEEVMDNYSLETLNREHKTKQLPVAAIATRNNPRINAQLGVFTIHHRDTISIEKIGKKEHVRKYEIPAKSKPRLAEELKLLGITKFQLFPELSSIGENIRSDVYELHKHIPSK
ncbi:MAG: FRG domain-containing protein [Smithella sp.]|jgi:hypothetical protein